MDGLSAGASIIAVISLAVQLGQGAQDLAKFFGTISDAPSEINRLRDLLGQLYAIAAGIRNVLEGQRRLYGDSIPMSDAIHSSLLTCQQKLALIQDLLKKVDDVECGRTLVSRSWARLRLAMKKDAVTEFERQLGQAMQTLNIVLTMNLMVSNTRNTQLLMDSAQSSSTTTVSINSSAALPHAAPCCELSVQKDEFSIEIQATPSDQRLSNVTMPQMVEKWRKKRSTTSILKTTKWMRIRSRLGSLEVLTCRKKKKTEFEDGYPDLDMEIITSQYLIRPSFLSWSLDLIIIKSGNAVPQLSLKTQHIISSVVYDKLKAVIRRSDFQGFQQMFSKGEISFNSITQEGFTLLSLMFLYATKWESELDMCCFILEQGCNPTETDAGFAWFWISKLCSPSLTLHKVFKIVPLICSKIDLSECIVDDIFDFELFLSFTNIALESVIFEAFWVVTIIGLNQTILSDTKYLGSALCSLSKIWCYNATEGVKQERNELARKLVALGADQHYVDETGRSILQNLVAWGYPQDGEAIVSEWLDLLQNWSVDVNEYLLQEAQFCTRYFEVIGRPGQFTSVEDVNYFCSLSLRKIDIWMTSSKTPSWTVLNGVNSGSSAATALNELIFCPDMEIFYPSRYKRGEKFVLGEEAFHTTDSLPETKLCNYDDLWPFHANKHTLCGSRPRPFCYYNLDLGKYWCPFHACRFNHTRFARKQKKKAEKRMKAEGVLPVELTIPGAWVD